MTNPEILKEELKSPEYFELLHRHEVMWRSLGIFLSFCKMNFSRAGDIAVRHFFLRVLDDFLQSVVAINYLCREGIHHTCRRELRYLLELSVKACLISQKSEASELEFEEQIEEHKKILKKSEFNLINSIQFKLFTEQSAEEFKRDVKRMYGVLSAYSHSTPFQVSERLGRENAGKAIGYEGTEELRDLNEHAQLTYSYIATLLAHALEEWVLGDFLVESNGERNPWHFRKSKYIAMLDERFDYKHERQENLQRIKSDRLADIEF
ncbi:hypothetical protein [Nitrincola sp.]|uniref:hypothetical protein n=1 Tax=Nitrincola sp. TaxID=1926584 RepID=UPI003A8D9268